MQNSVLLFLNLQHFSMLHCFVSVIRDKFSLNAYKSLTIQFLKMHRILPLYAVNLDNGLIFVVCFNLQ